VLHSAHDVVKMVVGTAPLFVGESEKAMLWGFRTGLSSAIGLGLVIASGAALAVCDVNSMAKPSSS
jgi:ABC-type nickel/cobalt efflux system permease component RcnA